MQITAKQVNELRQITGAGMMDCKKALQESNGEMQAAIDYLRKKGQKISDKRADRESNEGVVVALTSNDNSTGISVALNCETDFVAKNADFIAFAEAVANRAMEERPATKEELLSLDLNGVSIKEHILEQVAKIGEKIEISQYALVNSNQVVSYVHGNKKIGVLVALNKAGGGDFEAAGKDAAMQIAAMNPLAVDKDGIPKETIDRELDIAKEQIAAEGKPADLAEKIALGKLGRFFKDNTLLAQPFVKDGSMSVGEMLKKVDSDLTVTSFSRLAIGG
ncbi:MAG: elongation factor Ts [Bacteroidetes bacterium]|nr:elongation factor Ts [Bacteroidota bacterium]